MRGDIRLPAGGGRRGSFLKLLWRVDAHANNGFGFEGSLLRPGAWVRFAELRPSLKYPELPVLLEYSLGPAHGIAGHRRCDNVCVLWRWNSAEQSWRELGRAMSASWEWALDLRPLAIRALAEARHGVAEPVEAGPDLPAIAARLSGLLDEHLEILSETDRARVVCFLHDEFARRSCGL